MQLIPTIGLEVHCQLRTQSKLFCACPVTQGEPPNTAVCPVCLGYPGTLPRLNDRVVQLAVRAGLALGCTVHASSVFSRKHYFYPDLPKGYQISQFDQPICTAGKLHICVEGERSVYGIHRIHIEEDAGKMRHTDEGSRIDWNRSGTPLIEIVGDPDIHSPEAAGAWMRMLHRVVVAARVCTGDMEKGHFRCDANVSLAPAGGPLGKRVELKNINSFRFVERAIRGEMERQAGVLVSGGTVVQSTRSWTGSGTILLRSKEEAADYRYFPEPDLPDLVVEATMIAAEAKRLAGRPLDMHLLDEDMAQLSGFLQAFPIRDQDARILMDLSEVRGLFEAAVAAGGEAQAMANWVLGPVQAQRNADGGAQHLEGAHLAALEALVSAGTVNRSTARDLLVEVMVSGSDPVALVAERGLSQISDDAAIQAAVDHVLSAQEEAVRRYREGQRRVLGFLIGQVMRAFDGRADPATVRVLLEASLRDATDSVVSSGSTESGA